MNSPVRDKTRLVSLRSPAGLPKWQRDSISRLASRSMIVCTGIFAFTALIAILIQRFLPTPGAAWVFAIAPTFLLASLVIVSFAYRQGIRDARAHPADSDDEVPPNVDI